MREENSEGLSSSDAEIDLDSISQELGGFGWYHCRVVIIVVLTALFDGITYEYVFTAARIQSRCLIPECDTSNPEFSPDWILNAVPGTGTAALASCQRYRNVTASFWNETCPAELFDRDVITTCEEHVYEHKNTVVYDFNLACDEWRRSFIGSARTSGKLISLAITGYISDRWGRRTCLIITAFNAAWIGLSRYWATTYTAFAIAEFMEAVFEFGAYTCAYILMMELPGEQFRVIAGLTLLTFGGIGQVLVGAIAWAIPNWRHLTLAIYIPQLVSILYFWIAPESIRWYLATGRYDKAEKALIGFARANGKELSQKALDQFKKTTENRKRKLDQEQKVKEPLLALQIWRHKPILIRCLVTPFWWVTTTFIFYGLTINSVNLSGNSHFNFILVSAVGVPGYWIGTFLLNRLGRKPLLIFGFWVCGASQIGFILMPEGLPTASLALFLIGKLGICMVASVLYVYTGELYPTKCRHSLFGYSSMVGRIGSVVAPLTPALGVMVWDKLPYCLYASFAVTSGLLAFIIPETRGTKLPDTLEEAARLGKRNQR